MQTIHAIYENGVFRPLQPVTLPESIKVIVVPHVEVEQQLGFATDELYAIMSRSYDTGETDAAARIDEHQS